MTKKLKDLPQMYKLKPAFYRYLYSAGLAKFPSVTFCFVSSCKISKSRCKYRHIDLIPQILKHQALKREMSIKFLQVSNNLH